MKQPEASIAIQTLPGVGGEDVIRIVDCVIGYIRSTGLAMHVGPFETTVEGDFDTLMGIVREAQLICIREGAESVASYVKIFYNPNAGVWSIDKKISKHRE
ncbi:MAG: thiamine-binding protein [Clostridiales bacterium]|nr:thiamine-binding protein [Clostridiales bacterium]